MNAFEIVGGIILLLACVIIVAVVTMQETKSRGMSAVSGGDSEMLYGKGRAKTKEILLNKATKICAVVFFAVSLTVAVMSVVMK